MKQCRLCGEPKPLEDFYKGHARCKVCVRGIVREYRLKNIDRVREYDRNRPNRDERREKNKANYRKRISTPEGRKAEWEKKKKYINSEKRAANVITSNAIRGGRLVAQPCERCGATENIHAHHEDYSKPLDVNWLCPPCHGQSGTAKSMKPNAPWKSQKGRWPDDRP